MKSIVMFLEGWNIFKAGGEAIDIAKRKMQNLPKIKIRPMTGSEIKNKLSAPNIPSPRPSNDPANYGGR